MCVNYFEYGTWTEQQNNLKRQLTIPVVRTHTRLYTDIIRQWQLRPTKVKTIRQTNRIRPQRFWREIMVKRSKVPCREKGMKNY